MRIFYAVAPSPNADFASRLWHENFFSTLKQMGHELVQFDYDLTETMQKLDPADPAQAAFIAVNRPRLSAQLLQQVRAAHAQKRIDLLFSYFYDACILPETIDEIRSLGIVTANWYSNATHQFHLIEKSSPHYNCILTPEPHRIPDYRRVGARPVFCQMAANPAIYHPYDVPQEFDVTFVGQAYGDRPDFIFQLVQAGLQVRVWGERWNCFSPCPAAFEPWTLGRVWRGVRRRLSRYAEKVQPAPATAPPAAAPAAPAPPPIVLPAEVPGPILSDEEMIRLYSRSKINLGFSSCGETHRQGQRLQQMRLRDFEVPMSGGFYLAEYFEELENYYAVGKEIVCFRTAGELVEKARYYLAHDDEREAIRRAGRERCLRDHTFAKRFQDAFRELGLVAP